MTCIYLFYPLRASKSLLRPPFVPTAHVEEHQLLAAPQLLVPRLRRQVLRPWELPQGLVAGLQQLADAGARPDLAI